MDLILLIIVMSSIAFIVYELMSDGLDGKVAERLHKHSLSIGEAEKKRNEEIDEYFKQVRRNIAQKMTKKSKDVSEQKQILLEAGLSADDDTFLEHTSKKIINAALLGIMGLIIAILIDVAAMQKLLIIILLPLMGYRLPDIKMKKIAKQRAEEVTYTLPDAIDLLSVCVEAGLGIDSAITRVAREQELSAPILSQEFKRVGKDVVAGISRGDALRALAKRNSSPELRSFVSLLIQSDKLGTSISQALKVYSDTLRVKRRQKAEELAAKASIKMTIPLILFILPATFIVIMAPAAISMFSIFGGG